MKNQLLIIGMSPGNSYFKQEVIDKLIKYSLNNYEKVEVFIPDIPAMYTYIALGYPENIARKKAVLQGNAFRNRVNRVIQQEALSSNSISVFDWKKENLENDINYKKEYSYLKQLYRTNKDFQNDINEATSQVLIENPFKKKDILLSDIKIGTHYILSEFSFMMTLPCIRNNNNSFIYGYHKPWNVWEKFIDGTYDGTKRRPYIDFVVLPNFSK